ncbi:MAG: hypothetical protein JXR10_08060 [Cyclobacteriaceae bacterium]
MNNLGKWYSLIVWVLAGSLSVDFCQSQVLYPSSYLEDYNTVLELQNEDFRKRIFINPSIISLNEYDSLPEWNIWGDKYDISISSDQHFEVLPIVPSVSFNSNYPRSYNDGPVWRGKGLNAEVNFGVRGHFGILHYTVAPVLFSAQNKNYARLDGGVNPYNYPFGNKIDWVQQYGDGNYNKASWGQSDIRLIYKNLTLGLSTQNVVWGGARINPILMSNNAPMFPHLDFGTNTPIETKIGKIEFRSYWGLMQESPYFDDIESNDKRYFQGGGLHYSPSFFKGLSVGVSRVHYRNLDIQGFTFNDAFLSFADFSSNQDSIFNGQVVNDVYDQMISFNFRWLFPEIGFETYLELAKNDFSNIKTLATEPEHSRAYTIGFIKLFEFAKGRVIKMHYEHTTLGQSRLIVIRYSPSYYSHYLAPQGYTHQGQVIGAGIGTGSNSDIGMIDYYTEKGMVGICAQRIRFNDDYVFTSLVPGGPRTFDVEYTATLKAVRFIQKFALTGEASLSTRFNWQFIENNRVNNLFLRIGFGYNLSN